MQRYADRRDAGRALAAKLQKYHGKAVVLALPRGGVETGAEVARLLDAPLGLVIARKIGHPFSPEYAVCAVTETGPLICNEAEQEALNPLWLKQAEASERAEAKRRRQLYAAGRPAVSLANKVAVVVDDGIATGLTMLAAIAEVHKQHPRKLVVAVPAAPQDVVDELQERADEVVVLTGTQDYLGAVGAYYDTFPQLTDQEVMALLDEAG